MNDGWNEWGPRVPDPRMIGLRRAAPGRPAQDLFPLASRHAQGDILSDPPAADEAPEPAETTETTGRAAAWALSAPVPADVLPATGEHPDGVGAGVEATAEAEAGFAAPYGGLGGEDPAPRPYGGAAEPVAGGLSRPPAAHSPGPDFDGLLVPYAAENPASPAEGQGHADLSARHTGAPGGQPSAPAYGHLPPSAASDQTTASPANGHDAHGIGYQPAPAYGLVTPPGDHVVRREGSAYDDPSPYDHTGRPAAEYGLSSPVAADGRVAREDRPAHDGLPARRRGGRVEPVAAHGSVSPPFSGGRLTPPAGHARHSGDELPSVKRPTTPAYGTAMPSTTGGHADLPGHRGGPAATAVPAPRHLVPPEDGGRAGGHGVVAAYHRLPAPVADRPARRGGDRFARQAGERRVGWGDWARHGPERPVRFGEAGPVADGLMDGPTMKVSTSGDIVRPFITTSGRARPLDERLRMETLLSSTPAALSAPLAFEHAHIVELCRQPLSVAEIAAGLRLPVGVARVLIADLVTEHFLVIHAQVVLGARPPRELLERIRAGVRAL